MSSFAVGVRAFWKGSGRLVGASNGLLACSSCLCVTQRLESALVASDLHYSCKQVKAAALQCADVLILDDVLYYQSGVDIVYFCLS